MNTQRIRSVISNSLAGNKLAPGEVRAALKWRRPGPGLVPAIGMAAFFTLLASTALAQFEKPSPKNEADLIAVLRSDKPEGEKAIACKYLSIYGSDAAVPELAKLLANEHLASWARTALE